MGTWLGVMYVCVLFSTDGKEIDPKWTLWYSEDFSTPFNDSNKPWVLDNYSIPFDTIMDDAGLWYRNIYGPAWQDALDSFATYRKEFPVGKDGWLTASLSARDWNKDGIIESPPSLATKILGDDYVAEMNVPDHTGGVIFRNTQALPAEYRIEYKLKTIDFGGRRNGTIEYDGRINGYSKDGCKTLHPWPEDHWEHGASTPYCEWEDVREGPRAYNGFHFLCIADFADPAPRNNHFWHYRRKVLMDLFAMHPDRINASGVGRICNSNTKEYYDLKEGNFNTVNMWISGLPRRWTPNPGALTGNSQWFMTTCSDGVAMKGLSTAAELQPELMPNNFYRFAIERNKTGYILEASGNFDRVGNKTLRFYRPFVVDDVPIWHYNVDPDEYDGRYNNDLIQRGFFGNTTWPDQWPAGSAYPDYFVIGALYTNVYEGKASLTDIRLYGLTGDGPPTTAPEEEFNTSTAPTVASTTTAPEVSTTAPPVASTTISPSIAGPDESTEPTSTPSVDSSGCLRIRAGMTLVALSLLWFLAVEEEGSVGHDKRIQ